MPINSAIYTHDLDRAALQALKAIPGFTEVLKAFMKVWSEQMYRVENMATNLRISEKQLPQYYNMLPPISEKLGIEVPELYLKMDVTPNAYTSGDNKPFIVMTTGLLESMPEELIPTVLAHECGHIACHHVLYSTMGQLILNEAVELLGMDNLTSLPLKIAFYYWMRCSEYSADRAAAICDGTSDRVVQMCMNFAGFNKNIAGEASVEAFMEQAVEYNQLMKDSKWSKTLEFLMYSQATHPLNAVRAYEVDQWGNSDVFAKIGQYLLDEPVEDALLLTAAGARDIPMSEPSRAYVGRSYLEVKQEFESLGFETFELKRVMEKNMLAKNGQVMAITIEGREFARGDWYPSTTPIQIAYYEPATEEEIAAAHPGQIRVPDSARRYVGRNYLQVMNELTDAGFVNIVPEPQRFMKKNWLNKEGGITWISIGGQTQFERGAWFLPEAVVRLSYCTYENPADGAVYLP